LGNLIQGEGGYRYSRKLSPIMKGFEYQYHKSISQILFSRQEQTKANIQTQEYGDKIYNIVQYTGSHKRGGRKKTQANNDKTHLPPLSNFMTSQSSSFTTKEV
jgi:hypothetical protein